MGVVGHPVHSSTGAVVQCVVSRIYPRLVREHPAETVTSAGVNRVIPTILNDRHVNVVLSHVGTEPCVPVPARGRRAGRVGLVVGVLTGERLWMSKRCVST